MVFNTVMEHLHPDAALIDGLGGPAKVARLLGFEVHGTQRVFNWRRRGIPSAVKVSHPDLFLPNWNVRKRRTPAHATQAA